MQEFLLKRSLLWLFRFKSSVYLQIPAPHKKQPLGIEYIELAGDKKATEEWIGTDKLPLRWVDGSPGIKAVGIKTEAGTVVLH